jgi:hypothetical protein
MYSFKNISKIAFANYEYMSDIYMCLFQYKNITIKMQPKLKKFNHPEEVEQIKPTLCAILKKRLIVFYIFYEKL